jgi:hypothetical protein
MEEDHEVEEELLDVPGDPPGLDWGGAQEPEDSSAAESVEELPSLSRDEYLVVLPGGDVEIAQGLPKPRKLPKALVLHAGDLIVCEGRRRSTLRTPSSTVDDSNLPLAARVVMVFIEFRSTTPTTRSRRYLIVANENEDMLAWIDHSPPGWDLQVSQVRAVAQRVGLECSTERFTFETEFELAHPGWMG